MAGEGARLAAHELLELHEQCAFETNSLVKQKQSVLRVGDPELRTLYLQSIELLQHDIVQLANTISASNVLARANVYFQEQEIRHGMTPEDPFLAGDLLNCAKTVVRYDAFAITESANPFVREMLMQHFTSWVRMHERIFNYMHSRGLYPAHNVELLLQNDIKMAQMALQMPIHR